MNNYLECNQLEKLIEQRMRLARISNTFKQGFARGNVNRAFQKGFWSAFELVSMLYEKDDEWVSNYQETLKKAIDVIVEMGLSVDGIFWDKIDSSKEITALEGGRLYCCGVTAEHYGSSCYLDNYFDAENVFWGALIFMLEDGTALKLVAKWEGKDWERMQRVLRQ